ncbi:hypothetical protein FLI59_34365, partial [Pseudomonas aeruginosa]
NTAPTVVFCPMNIVDKVWVEQPLQHFKVPPRIWTSISGKVLEIEAINFRDPLRVNTLHTRGITPGGHYDILDL